MTPYDEGFGQDDADGMLQSLAFLHDNRISGVYKTRGLLVIYAA